jgi:homoserine/homoserine lactone efflux protein
MTVRILLLYFATWLLVALTPGPAVLCSVSQSTRYGFRSSIAGISGIQLGNLVFFVCIACGLGTLLAKAAGAFTVLRFIGAVYLVYLGARIILSSFRRSGLKTAQPAATLPAHRGLFLQGLLVQLTNPKALLFVSALLPQFIDPQRPAMPQLVILVLTTIAVDSVVLSSYAFAVHRGVRSFRASRLSAWLERVFGAVLVLFGFRLLLSRK